MSANLSWKKWLLIINVFFLIIAALLISRSFLVGYAAVILWVLNLGQPRSRIAWSWCIWLLLMLAVVFLVKIDSSNGRFLIYKVSWTIFRDNWWSGIGLGNFEILYGHYQAAYFGNGQFSTKELLLADSTYYAFNDYFQFIIETGITGLLLIIAASFSFIGIVRTAIDNAAANWQKLLVYLSASQILAIGIGALFTHVVEKMQIQVIVSACLMVLLWFSSSIKIRVYSSCLVALLQIILIIFHSQDIIYKWKYSEQWNNAKELKSQGAVHKARAVYESIYPALSTDAIFLQEYGDLLYDMEDYEQALLAYKRTGEKRTAYQLSLRIANCLEKTGSIAEAENHFVKAVNMVPNRFNSRLRLFRFYMRQGLYNNAWTCSRQILEMPVKVPSQQIDYIKSVVLHESARIRQKAMF